MITEARLALDSVSKRFGDTQAVKDLSLSLAPGEFLSLLGPSGCGKSTTMSMIAGFEVPDSGEIQVEGAVVNNVPPQKRGIGLVFQDYAVFSRLTVRSNLAFGLEAQHVPRAERKKRIADMAAQLDLEDVLDKKGATLNMSEMQRVALGRVLITRPRLLLLDEPMSNLDAAIRLRLRSELKRIQKELGQTVLYVTHDQVEAMSMSDRIAVMDQGMALQVGTPDEIFHHPVNRFVTEFIGDPPVNIVACQVRRDGSQLSADTACHLALPLGTGEVAPGAHHLAIRPHDISISLEPSAASAQGILRYSENFGSERVLHIEYGDDLLRAVVLPSFDAAEGTDVHLSLAPEHLLLIEADTDRVVPRL